MHFCRYQRPHDNRKWVIVTFGHISLCYWSPLDVQTCDKSVVNHKVSISIHCRHNSRTATVGTLIPTILYFTSKQTTKGTHRPFLKIHKEMIFHFRCVSAHFKIKLAVSWQPQAWRRRQPWPPPLRTRAPYRGNCVGPLTPCLHSQHHS